MGNNYVPVITLFVVHRKNLEFAKVIHEVTKSACMMQRTAFVRKLETQEPAFLNSQDKLTLKRGSQATMGWVGAALVETTTVLEGEMCDALKIILLGVFANGLL